MRRVSKRKKIRGNFAIESVFMIPTGFAGVLLLTICFIYSTNVIALNKCINSMINDMNYVYVGDIRAYGNSRYGAIAHESGSNSQFVPLALGASNPAEVNETLHASQYVGRIDLRNTGSNQSAFFMHQLSENEALNYLRLPFGNVSSIEIGNNIPADISSQKWISGNSVTITVYWSFLGIPTSTTVTKVLT